MSDETPSEVAAAPASASIEESASYLSLWAASLAQVLGQISGAAFAVEYSPEAPPAAPQPAENDLRLAVVAAGGLRGEMSLRLPRAVVVGLAQLFLSEPQDAAAEFKSDHQEAAEELLRQVAGHAATALQPRWGEVQLRLEAATPSWAAGAAGWLASAGETPCPVWIECQLSAALHAALVAAGSAQAAENQAAAEAPASPVPLEGNLDLLLNVELAVTLRFGGRTMLLRDVLELAAGSVVELDRQVEEPADLLLDGRLFARGEVVVVDGNYGLRVLQILPGSALE